MLLLTACSGSGAWRANEDGNEHFAAERYQDALESYREAQRREPENPTINLNVGRALHALGEFDRAESATLGAMRSIDPAIRAVALFHAGNHRWANDDLLGARAAFIESLREQPDLLDAKINLEIVNALLRESGIKLQDDADAFGQEGEAGDGPVGEGQSDPGEAEGEGAEGEPGGEAGAAPRDSQGSPTDRSGRRWQRRRNAHIRRDRPGRAERSRPGRARRGARRAAAGRGQPRTGDGRARRPPCRPRATLRRRPARPHAGRGR